LALFVAEPHEFAPQRAHAVDLDARGSTYASAQIHCPGIGWIDSIARAAPSEDRPCHHCGRARSAPRAPLHGTLIEFQSDDLDMGGASERHGRYATGDLDQASFGDAAGGR
jgi:hypothetical protein